MAEPDWPQSLGNVAIEAGRLFASDFASGFRCPPDRARVEFTLFCTWYITWVVGSSLPPGAGADLTINRMHMHVLAMLGVPASEFAAWTEAMAVRFDVYNKHMQNRDTDGAYRSFAACCIEDGRVIPAGPLGTFCAAIEGIREKLSSV